jgi:hypothetical protein
LSPPRQYSNKGDLGSPNDLTSTGGGIAAVGLNDVYQRLGSIQQSITYLEGQADDSGKKLESISADITSAKATYRTLKWVLSIGVAIFLGVWGFMATILTMMAKHYLGW